LSCNVSPPHYLNTVTRMGVIVPWVNSGEITQFLQITDYSN